MIFDIWQFAKQTHLTYTTPAPLVIACDFFRPHEESPSKKGAKAVNDGRTWIQKTRYRESATETSNMKRPLFLMEWGAPSQDGCMVNPFTCKVRLEKRNRLALCPVSPTARTNQQCLVKRDDHYYRTRLTREQFLI